MLCHEPLVHPCRLLWESWQLIGARASCAPNTAPSARCATTGVAPIEHASEGQLHCRRDGGLLSVDELGHRAEACA